MKKFLPLMLLFASSLASAGTPIVTYSTLSWGGVTRYYKVFAPANMPANPAMVVCLHATAYRAPDSPPVDQCSNRQQWNQTSKQYGFLLVTPASTYNPNTGQWFWNAYALDALFPAPPDDAGFLRELITTLIAQYGVNPKRVYMTGMSSGGFMTHKAGNEIGDLLAAIAPVSGALSAEPSGPVLPPNPISPVSVLEFHGDMDPIVRYCGGRVTAWGTVEYSTSVDTSSTYWASRNACQQTNYQPLCSNGSPSQGVEGFIATGCTNGVEVTFVREVGVGHYWQSGLNDVIWQFFAAHPKP